MFLSYASTGGNAGVVVVELLGIEMDDLACHNDEIKVRRTRV